jgi:hypothetical protein
MDFKIWELNYKANLVSNGHINPTLLHEAISKALRDQAGSIGYLIGEERSELDQKGGSDE